VYRKQADRLIVRDVRKRLAEMQEPDWVLAVVASMASHPDWYRHHGVQLLAGVQEVLEAGGVELISADRKWRFVGNERSATDD
jgi:hypothetical protein